MRLRMRSLFVSVMALLVALLPGGALGQSVLPVVPNPMAATCSR